MVIWKCYWSSWYCLTPWSIWVKYNRRYKHETHLLSCMTPRSIGVKCTVVQTWHKSTIGTKMKHIYYPANAEYTHTWKTVSLLKGYCCHACWTTDPGLVSFERVCIEIYSVKFKHEQIWLSYKHISCIFFEVTLFQRLHASFEILLFMSITVNHDFLGYRVKGVPPK